MGSSSTGSRFECRMTPWGILRRQSAILEASHTSPAVMRFENAQPTTSRENNSIISARYSQSSSVHRYAISLTYFWFGASELKSCASRLGATGRWCFELIVALYFLAALARRFYRCMLAATVLRSYLCPYQAGQESGEANRPAFSGQQRHQIPAYQEPCTVVAVSLAVQLAAESGRICCERRPSHGSWW